jgi:ABC-type nitrate/sulfonate/bicarbonate transport system substrate-binding protein
VPHSRRDLGKAYKIEWSQFQGTSVMSQALIAGALDCATQGVLPIAQGAAGGTLAVYIVAEHAASGLSLPLAFGMNTLLMGSGR